MRKEHIREEELQYLGVTLFFRLCPRIVLLPGTLFVASAGQRRQPVTTEGHLPGEPPSWARGHSDPPAGGCYSPVESPRPGLSKCQSRNPAVALQWRERLSAPPAASPGGWAGFIVHTLTSFKEWWAVPSLISPCASWCLTSFQCCRVVSFKVLSKIRRNYILP